MISSRGVVDAGRHEADEADDVSWIIRLIGWYDEGGGWVNRLATGVDPSRVATTVRASTKDT